MADAENQKPAPDIPPLASPVPASAQVAWPQFTHSADARSRLTRIAEIRRSILGSIEGKADQEPVTTDARTMRVLALLIGELTTEIAQCGGEDCMGRKVKGSVQWVTRDRLDAAREEIRRLTTELQLLKHGEFRF